MRCVRRDSSLRSWYFIAAALYILAVATIVSELFLLHGGGRPGAAGEEVRLPKLKPAPEPRNNSIKQKEELMIQPNDIPLLQDKGDWGRPGKGISMGSNGEPKSGTTWTQRLITKLAIHLCGSSTNTWCQMGGLKAFLQRGGERRYVFEMVNANTGELFLHFDGRSKHAITGFDVGGECNTRGRVHEEAFGNQHPCRTNSMKPTRESLHHCMPDTSEHCAQLMPSRDPATLRVSVVFRDPRDVIISEHRMRTKVYKWETAELDQFIYQRFETIVSWQSVRWIWYTTFYKSISNMVFYEDMQSKPEALADLASFMGLNSSLGQLRDVHEVIRNRSPHGTFDTYNLPVGTIKHMNSTMSRLLPKEFLARYGLSPTSRWLSFGPRWLGFGSR